MYGWERAEECDKELPRANTISNRSNTMVWVDLHHWGASVLVKLYWVPCNVMMCCYTSCVIAMISNETLCTSHKIFTRGLWQEYFHVLVLSDWINKQLTKLIFGMGHILACHSLRCWDVTGHTPWLQASCDVGVYRWDVSINYGLCGNMIHAVEKNCLPMVFVPKRISSHAFGVTMLHTMMSCTFREVLAISTLGVCLIDRSEWFELFFRAITFFAKTGKKWSWDRGLDRQTKQSVRSKTKSLRSFILVCRFWEVKQCYK